MIDPAKQIKTWNYLAKKIGATVSETWEGIGLLFPDGEWIYFKGVRVHDGADVENSNPEDYEQVQLKWMTQEEYDRLAAEHEKARQARAEAQRRAEYERLRAEFEGKP